jgi:hypothetical protein
MGAGKMSVMAGGYFGIDAEMGRWSCDWPVNSWFVSGLYLCEAIALGMLPGNED